LANAEFCRIGGVRGRSPRAWFAAAWFLAIGSCAVDPTVWPAVPVA
jgi:hypothetical protein